MIKVGITGGIGSGKSTVCRIFATLGIPIYYADDRAKQLMDNNQQLKEEILNLFGNEAYKNDTLNRKFISSIVFKETEKLEALNAAVHPQVAADYNDWSMTHKHHSYTLKEAALLIEANSYKALDKLIVVTCPIDERINRVVKRDNITKEKVASIINNQLAEEEKVELADYIVDNSGNESLINQVIKIHASLLKLSEDTD